MKYNAFGMATYFLYISLTVLVGMEIAFRSYIFDFYGLELRSLNKEEFNPENDKKETLLVLGDSFTANENSYVNILRDSLPGTRVINSAVPGTTVNQSFLSVDKRIRAFKPSRIIYQIYVGNDLIEFRHPFNIKELGWVRSYYWWLSDRIQVIGFVNYRMARFRKCFYNDLESSQAQDRSAVFASERYAPRTKMYFSAEGGMVEDVVMMKNQRKSDIIEYTRSLKKALNKIPDDIAITIVVIPHCSQIDLAYMENMRKIGMKVSNPNKLLQRNYPFITYLEDQLSDDRTTILNPLLTLQNIPEPNKLYFENDPHFDFYGQQALGRYLLDYFKSDSESTDQFQ